MFRRRSNPNNQWIYVVSSALANLPVGQRVSSANAASMPKIVTPNVAADLQFNSGANHWRFAGIHITSNSSYCPTGRNCMSYFLVGDTDAGNRAGRLPDSITFDRCYIHGHSTSIFSTGLS